MPATTVFQSQSSGSIHAQSWYRPIVSPQHGVYVMLGVSFLTGAAAGHHWTLSTTLALICAFAGFQAEHPLVLQIKQRHSWKPRFLLWGGIYAGLALGIAIYLYSQTPLLWAVYLGAIAAFMIDAVSVYVRQQKSIANELLTFGAVCLAAPLAYIATVGTGSVPVVGLWLLNSLFFSSAIFTVKLRKPKTTSLVPGLVYHAIASLLVFGLWYMNWLAPITAIAFVVALLKFSLILLQLDWYKSSPIRHVALLETLSSICFFVIVAVSVLPPHLVELG